MWTKMIRVFDRIQVVFYEAFAVSLVIDIKYTIAIMLSTFWNFGTNFSHTWNQANLFYICRTKAYFDPSAACIYS